MLRQKLRPRLHYLRKLFFQGSRDSAMQLLTAAAHQGTVGGILHQCMFECVFRIGWHPALGNQFGAHELREGVIDLLLRHFCNSADHLI